MKRLGSWRGIWQFSLILAGNVTFPYLHGKDLTRKIAGLVIAVGKSKYVYRAILL